MAIFNPDVGGIPAPNMPDQTGASRGQIPDTSLGGLLGDVGGIIKTGVSLYNEVQHNQIDQEVRKGYEEANKPFLDSIPAALKDSTQAMAELQNAYTQGKLSDMYYTGQLAALQKKIRSQYPQYEDYIDQSVQRITGIRPANAYHEAVMQEFAKLESEAGKSANFRQQWLKENEEYMSTVFGQELGADIIKNFDNYDFGEIQAKVAYYKAGVAEVTAANARIENALKQGTLSDESTEEAATMSLHFVTGTVLGSMGSAMGADKEGFLKKLQDASKDGYTTEEYTMLTAELGRQKLALAQALRQQMYAPISKDPDSKSYAALLGPDTTEKLIANAMKDFDIIEEYANNKDWGMVGYYVRQNNLIQQKDLNNILNASEDLRTANALGAINPQLATMFLNESGKWAGVVKDLSPESMARILTGQDSFDGVVDRIVRSRVDAASKAGGINALVDNALVTITSGLADPDSLKQTIQSVYSLDESGKDLFSYINPDEYLGLYNKMYSPSVVQAVLKSGDEESIQQLYSSALQRAATIPEFRKAAKGLQDVQEWSDSISVELTPGFDRLVISIDPDKLPVNPRTGKKPSVDDWIKSNAPELKGAINGFNSLFSTISPIQDAMGMSDAQKSETVQKFISDLNINLEAGKKDSFFDWLFGKTQEQKDAAAARPAPKGKEVDLSSAYSNSSSSFEFDTGDMTDFGSFKEKVRSAESGGSATAKNPRSSATGLYQFTEGTWNALGMAGYDRTNVDAQEVAMDRFTSGNADILNEAGIELSDQNLYAAHFLGAEAAVDVLDSPDTESLSDQFSAKSWKRIVNANPFLQGMSVGDFKAWLDRTMA